MKQYGNSPIINQLLENMAEYMAVPTEDFYNKIWNIETAEGFGLDIWGRIVGVGRLVKIDSTDYFGFTTGAVDWKPFNESTMFSGAESTSNYYLSDDAFRLLIFTKAFANITATTSKSINALLQILFAGRGRCYVSDLGSMQMRYTFEFYLEPWEFSVMINGAVLPRPAGVRSHVLEASLPIFGFYEAGYSASPFNQAPMLSVGELRYAA